MITSVMIKIILLLIFRFWSDCLSNWWFKHKLEVLVVRVAVSLAVVLVYVFLYVHLYVCVS